MRIVLDETAGGRRIDQVLAEVVGVDSRSQAEKLLTARAVEVNGKPAAKSLRVRSGDVVEFDDEVLAAPPPVVYADAPVPVLYQDEHVLVVDKPAGLVVHPAPGHKQATLVELLAGSGVPLAPADDAFAVRPGVVHRLDRDTSGVLVLAKDLHSLRTLQQLLRDRKVRREYTALVHGHLPSRAGRIEAAIGRDSRDASRRSLDTDLPQDAITHFVVQEVLPADTLLRLRLETGRTHQIRVHLQAIGHPVVGDPTYGGNGPVVDDYGLDRQFLHAARLTFPHPVTDETIEVTAPLPDVLQDALGLARRANATTR